MAGLSPSMSRAERSRREQANAEPDDSPRLLMSWEDWLTLGAAAIVFLSLAASIQAADLVRDMPAIVPTTIAGLVLGLFAARVRVSQWMVHPAGLLLGAVVVILAVQSYADGASMADRLADVRLRMTEWYHIVRAGDISNDNLPVVLMIHGIAFAVSYVGTWAVYRWHNAWIAVIPVGALLVTNLSVMEGQTTTFFVVFLFGALVLVARMHLQKRQAAWQREGVEYPEFMSLSVAQLTVVLAAVLMIGAWMVPIGTQARAVEQSVNFATQPFSKYSDHFVRLFHNLNLRGSGDFFTYGDSLPVSGEINLGTRQIYEVRGLEPVEEVYLLRTASYDEYTGAGWRVSDRSETRLEGGDIHVDEDIEYRSRPLVSIEVTVRDSDDVVMFPGIPFGTNVPTTVETGSDSPGDVELVRSRRSLREGDVYNAIGSVSAASADELRESGTDYPGWVEERYLQLPDDLPDNVRDAAAGAAGDGATPYDRARAIEAYFRALPFDPLVPAAPPGRDTVDFLINDLERGHFLYQATGMAVMLRSEGVPARVAVGYAVDPEDTTDDSGYVVRREDSYAWVEAFFPEYGWVNFNPTADRPGGGASEAPEIDPSDFEGTGFDPLMDDFLFPEGAIPPDIDRELNEDPVRAPEPFPWWIVWTAAASLLAVGAIASVGYMSWNWGLGSLPPQSRLWAKAQRLSRWAGFATEDGETPYEWSKRLGRGVGQEDAARTLARGYEEARYGRRQDADAPVDERSLGAYRELRGALVRMILRRRQRHGDD